MKTHIALLIILCLVLAAPALAQWSYENGPINGNVDAWTINFGYTVSDSYVAAGASVNGFAFGARELPGDMMTSVDWVLSTGPCSNPQGGCGTILGSGTASGSNLTDKFLSHNGFGFDIDLIAVSNLNVPETSGTEYWLTLENAMVPNNGDPVYWDQNSGIGCMSKGCPSTAYESAVGTVPSESFTITGGSGTTPEPGSFILLISGI